MLERLISILLFSLVFAGFLVVYFQTSSSFINSAELLNVHRRAVQVLLNLSGVKLSGSPNSIIQEPLLNHPGFRVELFDLEDNITWFYGEVNHSFSIGLPLLVNNHLGKGVVYCALSSH